MKEFPKSGPGKSLLTALALVALAAGSARAQTNEPKPAAPGDAPSVTPAGTPPAETPAPPPPPPAPPPALEPPPPPPPLSATPGVRAQEGLPHPAEIPASVSGETSWFTRTPMKVTYGSGPSAWAFTVFGTIQADYIHDTTRSYNDYIGQSLVARDDTYEGVTGRTQFGMRNTRVGILLDAPVIASVTPSAVFQLDFAGNQPALPYVPPGSPGEAGISENSYYNNPTARIRHAYFRLRNPIVDVLAGQTFDVFGWQNFYYGTSLLGLPNTTSSRNPQLRISKSFGVGGPLVFDIALEAARPGQRDSRVPDFMGGLRLSLPGWQGITTPGSAVTIAAPLSIGVSGVWRQFYVNAFTPPPAQSSNSAVGWGVSGDIFIPVIPARGPGDRSNKLSLIGSFVWSSGIADLLVVGGGARFPNLPNAAQQSPPPKYTPDVDNALVTFDLIGVLHTIDWWTAKGAFQFYFPGGRLFLTGNFTYAHSRNIGKLYPQGGREIELLASIIDRSLAADLNLLFDATPSVRFGLAGVYTRMRYLDHREAQPQEPHNIRGIATAMYTF